MGATVAVTCGLVLLSGCTASSRAASSAAPTSLLPPAAVAATASSGAAVTQPAESEAAPSGAAASGTAASEPAAPLSAVASGTASSGPASGAAEGYPGEPSLESDYIRTIKAVLPSVVLIQSSTGLGSGVVFDQKGDIVTNAHVVGADTSFQVTLANRSKSYPAVLVGSYPADDLAVVRVQGAGTVQPATFVSSNVEVGDVVLAMGNPLGLASSVTDGIVSAVGRTLTEPAENGGTGATLPDCIQTSAAINPGNSGGALVNMRGEVIGIPTLTATDPELGGTAPGIGFAISGRVAQDIAGQLISQGKVTNSHRAALGVNVSTVADASGQPAGVGVAALTPGGPAAKAGVQVGDVIVSVNGTPTPTTQDLSVALAALQPGRTVPVKVTRANGTSATFSVTLGSLS